MDSKRVTRARKMNTAEQENETSMSAPTSRSSETGTSSTHTWDHGTNENLSGSSPGQERIDEEVCDLHADTRSDRVDAPNAAGASDATLGPLAANMRNRSPAHQLNIDDSNRNVNTARQKNAALLAQLEFEQLESERIAARAAVARTKMLLLRLEADEQDSGDLIDCDNASHLSKTDKLEKRTVTLGDIEPVPESSPTTAPPPPPTACSEINSASPRNTDSNMSESTLADAIVLAIKTASKETSKIVNEPSKTLADLPSFCGNVSEWIAFRSVYNDTSGLFSNVQNVARIRKALSGEARETCEALIYTETDPLQIMRVLERRFGRPDAIIKQELNKLRRMTPMNGGMGNISSFANKRGGSRNLRPTPERRPRRTNTINTMKYDDNNSNSHTAFQPSNRSTINVKMICPLCNNEHGLPDCGEFVKLNMSEKWDAAGFACVSDA
ncbi:hypothetical protein EVAR_36042_1 [Eumeta japonica]|uniref:Uncharacterized protein n=1 Tax=Eumeta variegata TaxID=151549 RepID=A0A4C1WRT0_EUMVA|nr:hypothetical protein EVAR_36042_1 [Eumeta japonica]